MKTFLFQGDSITDASRSRDNDETYGLGYPTLFAADYLCREPQALRFYNRAVSGNRVVDLYARIRGDLINLRPDVVSVLIGVNDVWHEIGSENGVQALAGSSVVFKKIVVDGKTVGAVGVIGPQRMDYSRVVSTIRYLAGGIADAMNDGLPAGTQSDDSGGKDQV